MAGNPEPPTSGLYRIVSVLHGERATSVNSAVHLPTQVVRLGLEDSVWELQQLSEGSYLYRFSIPGRSPYSGVERGKVVATVDRDKSLLWKLTYRLHEDAYTIERYLELRAGEDGWTVAHESDHQSEITFRQIRYLPPRIEPPFVAPNQLFRFVPLHA